MMTKTERLTEVWQDGGKDDPPTDTELRMALDDLRKCVFEHRLSLEVVVRRLSALRRERDELRALVAKQAEDEGLWFIAKTAPEAYLQQELRKIHAKVEGEGESDV